MHPLRRLKIAAIVPLCFVAALIVVRQGIIEYYRLELAQELKFLATETGATTIGELAPKPPAGTPDNPAHVIKWEDLNCPMPEARDSYEATFVTPDSSPTSEPDQGQAYSEFTNWLRLELAPDARTKANRWRPPQFNYWNDQWVPPLQSIVDACESPLARVKREAELGTGYFERDWSATQFKGAPRLVFPECTALRNAARLLQVEAVLKARGGDMKGAFEDVLVMLRLRRFIDDYPVEAAKLMAIGLDDIAFSTIKGVLVYGCADKEQAEALYKELGGREAANSLYRPLLGATVAGIMTYDAARKDIVVLGGANPFVVQAFGSDFVGQEEVIESRLARFGMRFIWLDTRDEYHYLRAMDFARKTSKLPCADSAVAFNKQLVRSRTQISWLGMDPLDFMSYHLVGWNTPAQMGQASARTALARAAVALARYKSDNGAYPSSLAELAPEYLPQIPIDPCDGTPLKYTPNGKGYTIYSSGADGVNGGGAYYSDVIWESGE